MTEGWQIKEELDHVLDAVIDAATADVPTTVVDLTEAPPRSSASAPATLPGSSDASTTELQVVGDAVVADHTEPHQCGTPVVCHGVRNWARWPGRRRVTRPGARAVGRVKETGGPPRRLTTYDR